MQVNEKRLDRLLIKLDEDNISCCPMDDDGKIIDCENAKFCCSDCWKNFLTEQPPAPIEAPAMIRMVSDQLQIDPEILK